MVGLDPDLYEGHDKASGPGAELNRAELHPHPHPHGDEQQAAEHRALRQAIEARKAENAKPKQPTNSLATDQQPLDHDGRRPEARSGGVVLAVWINGCLQHINVKSTN